MGFLLKFRILRFTGRRTVPLAVCFVSILCHGRFFRSSLPWLCVLLYLIHIFGFFRTAGIIRFGFFSTRRLCCFFAAFFPVRRPCCFLTSFFPVRRPCCFLTSFFPVRGLPCVFANLISVRRGPRIRFLIDIPGFPVICILIWIFRRALTILHRDRLQRIGQSQFFQPRPKRNGLLPDLFRQIRKAGYVQVFLLLFSFRRKDEKCLQYIWIRRKQYAQA